MIYIGQSIELFGGNQNSQENTRTLMKKLKKNFLEKIFLIKEKNSFLDFDYFIISSDSPQKVLKIILNNRCVENNV